jgi:hypothetical protein
MLGVFALLCELMTSELRYHTKLSFRVHRRMLVVADGL